MAILDSTIVNGDLSVNGNLNAEGLLPQGIKLKYLCETNTGWSGALSLTTLIPDYTSKVGVPLLIFPIYNTSTKRETIQLNDSSTSGKCLYFGGVPIFCVIYTSSSKYYFNLCASLWNSSSLTDAGNVLTVECKNLSVYNAKIYEVIG